MKRLGVFLLLLDGILVIPLQGNPPTLNPQVPIYTPWWRGTVRVKCLTQEHNTNSLAKAPAWTARPGVEHTNHNTNTTPIQHLSVM